MNNLINFFEQYFYFEILDQWGAPLLMGFFVLLLVAETRRRLRKRKTDRWNRIKTNIGVAVTAIMALRLALIPALVLLAVWAEDKGAGLLNWLEMPGWITYVVAFLLLDYGNYLWHVLNHRFNFLWRFHNVHHIDLDLDVTTAVRFHFGEVLLSVLFRGLMIIVIGPPFTLVLVYEIIFEGATLFHHSNWRLPYRVEKTLSWFIVTPRMHGVHHSIVKRETDSNYSVIFNCWDRLHRTIRLNIPQQQINIGVPSYRDPEEQDTKSLLLMPFRKPRPWQLPNGTIPERKSDQGKTFLEP